MVQDHEDSQADHLNSLPAKGTFMCPYKIEKSTYFIIGRVRQEVHTFEWLRLRFIEWTLTRGTIHTISKWQEELSKLIYKLNITSHYLCQEVN